MLILLDKIYIVTSEWSTNNGDHEFSVIGAFFDMREAVECMNKERNIILTESFDFDSVQEARENDDVEVEEEDNRFFIMDKALLDKWDELKIHERLVKQRDFIAIQFEYAGETFEDRVYLDQIDLTHYNGVWDWWFGSHNDKFPNLNFELTADKDENGNPSLENAYINVYPDDEALEPIEIIKNVKLQKTWMERRSNHGER